MGGPALDDCGPHGSRRRGGYPHRPRLPGNKEDGWFFSPTIESEQEAVDGWGDHIEWDRVEPYSQGEFTHLHQVYAAGGPSVTGRVTVPLLFDTVQSRCVATEI